MCRSICWEPVLDGRFRLSFLESTFLFVPQMLHIPGKLVETMWPLVLSGYPVSHQSPPTPSCDTNEERWWTGCAMDVEAARPGNRWSKYSPLPPCGAQPLTPREILMAREQVTPDFPQMTFSVRTLKVGCELLAPQSSCRKRW